MSKHTWAKNLILTTNINGNNYDYYEIRESKGQKYFYIHDYTKDTDILKKLDYIVFVDNFDLTWHCDFVRLLKNNVIKLRVI